MRDLKMRSTSSTPICTIVTVVLLFLSSSSFTTTEGYQSHYQPKENITVQWDVISWTPDGYVAVVTIHNYQKQRSIGAPGWELGWTWGGKEIIWAMVGAQTTYQGDCSKFKGNIPHSCKKTPTVVDLLPGTPYNMQIENCCKGGLLSSSSHGKTNSTSAFQIAVGQAGNTVRTVKLPVGYKFTAPRAVYTCGPARVVRPTKYITPDRRRTTQALKTWKVVCLYSGKSKN